MAILRPDSLVDSYFVMLDGCAGAADQVFDKVIEQLDTYQPPNVRVSDETVSTGRWASIAGKKRKVLQISNDLGALKDFVFYVTSEPYGTALSVGWYLTGQSGFAKRLASMAARVYTMGILSAGDLDLFESQELQNFATVVHNCVVRVADSIVQASSAGRGSVATRTRAGFVGAV